MTSSTHIASHPGHRRRGKVVRYLLIVHELSTREKKGALKNTFSSFPYCYRAVAIGTAATAMAVPVFGLTFTIESRLCSARDQRNSAMPVP